MTTSDKPKTVKFCPSHDESLWKPNYSRKSHAQHANKRISSLFFSLEKLQVYMHVSMMEALEITHVAGDSSTNPIEDKRYHAWELLF